MHGRGVNVHACTYPRPLVSSTLAAMRRLVVGIVCGAAGACSDSAGPRLDQDIVVPAPELVNVAYEALDGSPVSFVRVSQSGSNSLQYRYMLDAARGQEFGYRWSPAASYRASHVSPNGQLVAFEHFTRRIMVSALDGSGVQPASPAGASGFGSPYWMPNGQAIVMTGFANDPQGGTLYDVYQGRTEAPELPTLLVEFPRQTTGDSTCYSIISDEPRVAVSASGAMAMVCPLRNVLSDFALFVAPAAPPRAPRLVYRLPTRVSNGPYVVGLAWSPDGQELAVLEQLANSSNHRVSVVDVDAGTSRALATLASTAPIGSPSLSGASICWSAGGGRIVFTAPTQANEWRVHSIRPDGAGLVRVTNGTASDADTQASCPLQPGM